jgi:hypothetical protein
MVGEAVEIQNLGQLNNGQQSLVINTTDLANGIYFVRLDLNQGGFVATEKIAVMR